MRLHIIDGTYELFRAHHSPRPSRRDPAGRDVKATVGMVGSLLALLAEEDVSHVAVAFDNPIESFRNDLFAGYKDSSGIEPELLAQFDPAESAVAALGVTVWSMEDVEADDAMATGAARFSDAAEEVLLLTADKDLGQCVRDPVVVQVDTMRGRRFDEAGVVERLGVPPASVPDYLALVGDSADGIPGVKGIGAKTAASLLGAYGHVEHIPPDPDDWTVSVRGAAGIAERLVAQAEDVRLYRRLATLLTDVELPGAPATIGDLRWDGVPRDRFLAWCDEAGVEGLRDRPHRWA